MATFLKARLLEPYGFKYSFINVEKIEKMNKRKNEEEEESLNIYINNILYVMEYTEEVCEFFKKNYNIDLESL